MPDTLTFHDARQLVADVLGPSWRVRRDGWEDGDRWLVTYEPADRDDPGWDLPILTVAKRGAWVTSTPWQAGIGMTDNMQQVTDPEA